MSQEINIRTELLQLLSPTQARHYKVVPKDVSGSVLQLWVNPSVGDKEQLAQELNIVLGKQVELFEADEVQLDRALGKYYRDTGDKKRPETGQLDMSEGNLLMTLIREAAELDSSDIHIEPYEDRCRVRMRIDGMLTERYVIKKAEYPALVNKIKIQAHLDIAEKRLPQDGRILFDQDGVRTDIRVSVVPTLYGEKVVMRLLGSDASELDIEALGMTEEELRMFLEGVRKPHGIVLVSGPTGSGKTTTLYATLKHLNKTSRNIMTVEDPIEYTLQGINQVQVKEGIGLTFSGVLRSFLRQDPDVIMVGEIRDADTAAIAVRAALTGHLVLSTIHTNSAWGTVSRLVDMGLQPFLLANTLNTSVAQRLVRMLCPHCKVEVPVNSAAFPLNFDRVVDIEKMYEPEGCEECHYVGYKGRKAIFEVIVIDRDLAQLIIDGANDSSSIQKNKNIRSLKDQAYELVRSGDTSLEEVYAILAN